MNRPINETVLYVKLVSPDDTNEMRYTKKILRETCHLTLCCTCQKRKNGFFKTHFNQNIPLQANQFPVCNCIVFDSYGVTDMFRYMIDEMWTSYRTYKFVSIQVALEMQLN